ncbi:MAG: hypothetical protein A2611_01625 [Candidatus Komeilibacteria bacterium RIFOXYD1_FULL_37_29]|nr:MAG: hypothetical protein A2611_01625 [Candidatus Komeilibacteria bacterium RIFOXYD1_FULL_37_29]
MKVISLGLDRTILKADSAVAIRAILFGELLDKYFIVVPAEEKSVKLSDRTEVLAVGGFNKFFSLFKIYQYLKAHLKNNHYHLMSIQDICYLASVGINLAHKVGLKVELQVHGLEKLAGFRKLIAQNNLRQADKIRTVSERLKQEIISKFGIEQEKIYIVPVAIDKDKILNSQSAGLVTDKPVDNFIFLTVARLVPVKNIAMQIRALARLKNKNTQLIIVGEGEQKDDLLHLVKQLKLSDRVNFIGWSDDVTSYYRRADCFLLSSNSEGYGMVIAEAVLSGLPIIMTDVGVAGELVKDNINGLVVTVGDQSAFSQAMDKMSSEDNLREKFSVGSLSFKDKILDKPELIEQVVDNWRKIYHG